MFIPLHDANPLEHIKVQFVTWGIIALNVLVYLFVNVANSADVSQAMAISYGYIPAVVNNFEQLPPEFIRIPANFSLVSYSFLHADFMHLIGNMLFLWVFGDNIEDAMGHLKFVIFYLLCAIAGALAHGALDEYSVSPLIGASGAVAGVIGAYVMLHPRVKVWVLVLFRVPLRLPAYIPLLFWIGLQVFMIATNPEDAVSWSAHIGGFFVGAILVIFLKRSDVRLFDRPVQSMVSTPGAVPSVEDPSGPTEAIINDDNPPNPWGRGK